MTVRGWGWGGSTLAVSLTVKFPFFTTFFIKKKKRKSEALCSLYGVAIYSGSGSGDLANTGRYRHTTLYFTKVKCI